MIRASLTFIAIWASMLLLTCYLASVTPNQLPIFVRKELLLAAALVTAITLIVHYLLDRNTPQ